MAENSSGLTPVVKTLLGLIIGIFLADILIADHAVSQFGAFSILSSILKIRVWEFITFQFIHTDLLHVMMNAICLYFFGPLIERWMGAKRFLIYYLTCGVGGALLFVILVYSGAISGLSLASDLVGASAGIYGLIVAAAIHAPKMEIQLMFPPVIMTMRQLAIGAIVIAVAIILFGIGANVGGQAAHLGGLIMGYLLITTVPELKTHTQRIARKPKRKYQPKIRPRTEIDLRAQSAVDEILDKISSEGFQSLTDKERELLHRASKKEQD